MTSGVLTGAAASDCSYKCDTCGGEEYDCSHWEGANVYDYTSLSDAWCMSNTGTLPNAADGAASGGAHGTLTMQEGEKIFKNALGTYKEYSAGTVNGYAITDSTDAESYEYIYRKVDWQGWTPVESDIKLATMHGGKAGKLNSSGAGSCCYNCGHRASFPNSAGGSPHCAQNGTDGYADIHDTEHFGPVFSLPKEEGLYVSLDKFVYHVGCHGIAGEVKTAMFPATGTRNFKFAVGKGGDVSKNGGDTYFGWIQASGGAGAEVGCISENITDVNSTSVKNTDKRLNTVGTNGVANGGIAGTFKFHGEPGVTLDKYGLPLRNYKDYPLREDDKNPDGRWSYDNSKSSGSTGMIVVSW